jgi:hypothetical protein
MTMGTRIRAAGSSDAAALEAVETQVSATYFATLRIPVVRGSGFAGADSSRDVAVMNEALAKRLFGAADPIGQGVEFGIMRGAGRRYRVVGVTTDSRVVALAGEPRPLVYRPFVDPRIPRLMLVRSVLSDRETAGTIERIAAELDSSLPVNQIRLTELVVAYVSERRLFAKVLSLFALIALGLAAAGLYGLVGFGVALRTREFGIRAALGAEPRSILRLVLREAVALATVGVGLGLAGAALGSRVIQSRLYGVGALDPVSYAGAAGVLALVALIASLRPARMASRVDPGKALRYE